MGTAARLSKGDPAAWHCAMHEAFLNGMTQRWADTAMNDAVSFSFSLCVCVRARVCVCLRV